ncbi:MAG: DUF3375 family protein [Ruthenibacterium sp.]
MTTLQTHKNATVLLLLKVVIYATIIKDIIIFGMLASRISAERGTMADFSYLGNMSLESLQNLREHHPARKLLAATRTSFVILFLYTVFVADNNREIPEYRLVAHLKEYLEIYTMREFDARELLTQWAGAACHQAEIAFSRTFDERRKKEQ